MTESAACPTLTMTLGDVIDRLSRHPRVEGMIVIGSARDAMPPHHADYDLVIVLRDPPLPLHVGVTWVDHRFTDLVFVTAAQVQALNQAAAPVEPAVWLGRLGLWLRDGRIAFDRAGLLHQAQGKTRTGSWMRPLDDADVVGAWNDLNYNVAQTQRMLAAEDPVYLLAADVRMAWFGTRDLLTHYMTIRRLPQGGEKDLLRILRRDDPDYFARFQRFLHTAERHAKFELYVELATRAAAPLGGLWPPYATTFQLERSAGEPPNQAQAVAFWHELIGAV